MFVLTLKVGIQNPFTHLEFGLHKIVAHGSNEGLTPTGVGSMFGGYNGTHFPSTQ